MCNAKEFKWISLKTLKLKYALQMEFELTRIIQLTHAQILVGFFRHFFLVQNIHISLNQNLRKTGMMTLETIVSTYWIVIISSFEYHICKVDLDQTVICVNNTKFVNYSSFEMGSNFVEYQVLLSFKNQ